MQGQWIGDYWGTNSGQIIVNIDDLGSHFQGVAYLAASIPNLPGLAASFRTTDTSSHFQFRASPIWVTHPNGNDLSAEDVQKLYPEANMPRHADVSGQWEEQHLTLSWQTDTGTEGACKLPRSKAGQPSELVAEQMDWAGFKSYVVALSGKRHLFRGQKDARRLRTAFHRRSRADLIRFVNEDIPVLHRHLSVRTRHIFDLAKPAENGAFFNLVQHHGYPTPLLDWTYSPYVAAFFAYRGVRRSVSAMAKPEDRVRVFILDQRWRTEVSQFPFANRPFPHFSIQEFIAIENERMIPQQSVSGVSNVDDIETHIYNIAQQMTRDPYLKAIDLPVSQRDEVFRELAFMGVTAGSLFPGFDGACEELKERNFLD